MISASGMATGGRIVHHLKRFAPDPASAILLAGFQAAGTRGASLAGGVAEIKIHGRYVPVRAEVARIDSLSAHADQRELLALLAAGPRPRQVCLVHGEPGASDALRLKIAERLGWSCAVPEYGETVRV